MKTDYYHQKLNVLPQDLSNNLRLRVLGNEKNLGKLQTFGETKPSAQFRFEKEIFGNFV